MLITHIHNSFRGLFREGAKIIFGCCGDSLHSYSPEDVLYEAAVTAADADADVFSLCRLAN